MASLDELRSLPDEFCARHLGPRETDIQSMLGVLGLSSLENLVEQAVPRTIRFTHALAIPEGLTEHEVLQELRQRASENRPLRSFIGLGYVPTLLPPVIQRNVLENPGYYTQYTPYQAEIAQGRLEALLNFQTAVTSLTGLALANASLLDEATAAAEAMALCRALSSAQNGCFFTDQGCHPQTLAVLQTRAQAAGVELVIGDPATLDASTLKPCGVLLQYPSSDGRVWDPRELIAAVHAVGGLVAMATDLLTLALLTPPGELGADVALGSTQRFGMPLGYGGPHAAYLATREECKRLIPGRIVGVSRDAAGNRAYRLSLQTREQHIRRERATSNICTAQVLPAIVASFYAVYHGPVGIRRIAERIAGQTQLLALGLEQLGLKLTHNAFFDTLRIELAEPQRKRRLERARELGLELRSDQPGALGITLGEPTTLADLRDLWSVFAPDGAALPSAEQLAPAVVSAIPANLRRATPFLEQPVFSRYHAEHELLRYIKRLESRDLSLTTAMIPLGSCTMKLNATAEMMPITWPEFAQLHPFTDSSNALGLGRMLGELSCWLGEVTGMAAISLQPNSGAQGEYAGLLVIRAYHAASGQGHRDVCLIPVSAHGTNPASAVLAGLRVVAVACDAAGNVDLNDLRRKAEQHAERLAALMVTYPSTHGVFEENIRNLCEIVHAQGGQVYLDGANMNAQVGLCRPGDFGADVCHLNLHKTFATPHGGGGPGMGPIAVAAHLAPYLPANPLDGPGSGAVSAAPFGSGIILTIAWAYIRLMGAAGLRRATAVAILNANYMARRLAPHYPVLYAGPGGWCAHEFIIDARALKKTAGIEVDDIAKRLMDYGFHAPTMSFPVPGTLMIEPTESESRQELDRLCDALISIRQEIREIEEGRADRSDNPLKHAPHTARAVTASEWNHSYSREQAAFPDAHTREHKFFPYVARIDNAAGDRNLICTCSTVEEAAQSS